MLKLKQRTVWFLFLTNAFLILLVTHGFNFKYFINLLKNYKEIFKMASKFTEDGDYNLVYKKDKI